MRQIIFSNHKLKNLQYAERQHWGNDREHLPRYQEIPLQ